jgi:site-specific DNA recombinase
MRILGRVRLSRFKEESTSVERQRELIEQYANLHDHTIVGWAEDTDVSGSVSPFDAPGLGPWLREDKQGEWDVLVVWRLDRLSRRVIALNEMFGWMLEHNKTLVSMSESLDLSNWVGRLVANVIAGVAEGELEAIKERTKASRKKLLENGRWPGGQVPLGLTPVELPGGGYRLGLHPEEAPIVRGLVDDVIAGGAVEAVAAKHNMLPSTLWKMMGQKYLLGHATYEGQTVRDLEGKPVLNAEPILTQDTWDQLQSALEARRRGPHRTRDTAPMNGVVKCYICDQNLFHKIYHRDYGKGLYRYYHCRVKGHCAQVDAEMVEEQLTEAFLNAVGDHPVSERIYRQAEDHTAALEDAVRAVDELTPLLGTVTSNLMKARLTAQLEALDKQIADLEKLPVTQSGWEYVSTNQTYAEVWDAGDTEQRRELLLRSGITFKIQRIADTAAIRSELYVPDEIKDRLNAKNPPS